MTSNIFCPLASGSKGNATLLSTPQGTVLIDAGISVKTLIERLDLLKIPLSAIQAILISHEHHDHTAALKTLAFRHGIPVVANYATAEAIAEDIGECPKFHIFTTGEPFEFLGFEVTPFSVQHDGVDPVAFTIKTGTTKIGLCTDLGFATSTVRGNLRDCKVLYVEANHQEEMVFASSRPDIYKKRVLSRTGHLSNANAARLIAEVAHEGLSTVYLAHLSSECNTPETALNVVSTFLKERSIFIDLSIAHQHKISEPSFF